MTIWVLIQSRCCHSLSENFDTEYLFVRFLTLTCFFILALLLLDATNPLIKKINKLRNIVSLFIYILQLNREGLNTGAVHRLLNFFDKINNFLSGA